MFWIVSVPPTRRPFVAKVNVTPAATLESKVTLPPNSCATAPKDIVTEAFDRNVIGAAKLHDAELDPFVHVPLVTVQVPPAAAVMYPAALSIDTFPEMATVEPFDRRTAVAPVTRSPPAVRGKFVPDVSRVPRTVTIPAAVTWLLIVYVPETVSAAKPWVAARVIDLAAPVRVTEEPVEVNPVADEVFQTPATLSVAEPKASVAAPADARSEANVAVVPVRVSVPDQVIADAKVVVTADETVRLLRVCGMFVVPPEAFTTTVDVPTVNVPRWVSIEVTVSVDPLATIEPPALTFRATAFNGSEETPVFSVVTPVPPATVRVPAVLSPRAARVNVTVAAPALNVTLLNSLPARFVPANVIV